MKKPRALPTEGNFGFQGSPRAVLFGEALIASDLLTGEASWNATISQFQARIAETVRERSGYPVPFSNETYLALFDSVQAALRCAVEIADSLERSPVPATGSPVRVRQCVHWGAIERIRTAQGEEYVGDCVDQAKRAVQLGPYPVLATKEAAEAGELPEGFRVRDLGELASDDPGTAVHLCELLWEDGLPSWARFATYAARMFESRGIRLPEDLAEHHDCYLDGAQHDARALR